MTALPAPLAVLLLAFTHCLLGSAFAAHLRPDERLLPLQAAAALLAYYALGRAAVERAGGAPATRRRRRAWLLALAAAGALSCLGAGAALELLAAPPGAFARYVASDPPRSRQALVCFGVFLLLDLLVGFFDYGELVDPSTGWAHHTFFVCAGAWTLSQGACGFFLGMAVVEVPTLVLGLGALSSALASDALFGATFVALRLAYTAWYTARMLREGPQSLALVMLPVCALHVAWFYTWWRGSGGSAAKAD
jgi:hypothetical protein